MIVKVSSKFGSVFAPELGKVDLHALPMASEEDNQFVEEPQKDITANSPESPF